MGITTGLDYSRVQNIPILMSIGNIFERNNNQIGSSIIDRSKGDTSIEIHNVRAYKLPNCACILSPRRI